MRMSPPAGLPGYPPPAQPGGNRLAVVAFGLACAVVVMFVLSSVVLSNHQVEFDEFTKAMTQSGGGFAGQVKAMSEFVEERGGVLPQWLYVLILLSLGAIGVCVASLVCALFAIRRPAKRGYAVAALVICSLFLLANCAGMLAGP
jgi:4-amino-4-deoxy-L-arabinose transferase-like glycosyltransferase